MVGLEQTLYTVPESVEVLEVCAVVYQPDITIDCPIDLDFEVELTATDDTAGRYTHMQYSLVG